MLNTKEKIVVINNHALDLKEFQGQRVITLKDADRLHGRSKGTAWKYFDRNKNRFIMGVDYFVRNSDESKREYGITCPNGLTILTETGYLMLVKSLNDTRAWVVQRQLVDSYFRKAQVFESPKIDPPYKPTETLAALNETARIILPVLGEAGLSPKCKVFILKQLYSKGGIDITVDSSAAKLAGLVC